MQATAKVFNTGHSQAVRFPRMARWRQDKPVEEADDLATLQALLMNSVEGPERPP